MCVCVCVRLASRAGDDGCAALQQQLRNVMKKNTGKSAMVRLRAVIMRWKEQGILRAVGTWRTQCNEEHAEEDALRAQMQVDIVNKFLVSGRDKK